MQEPRTHPIFEKYDVGYLVKQTRYTRQAINAMKRGALRPSDKFRRIASLALGEPEEKLFLPWDCNSRRRTKGSNGRTPAEGTDGAA